MKIVAKNELRDLIENSIDARIVFAEYTPSVITSDIMLAEKDFGATDIAPLDGEVFCWDWNIEEYKDDDTFVVYEVPDILQMIRTLIRGLPEDLLSISKSNEIAQLKSDYTDDRRYKSSVCVKGQYAIKRKENWFCADAEGKE